MDLHPVSEHDWFSFFVVSFVTNTVESNALELGIDYIHNHQEVLSSSVFLFRLPFFSYLVGEKSKMKFDTCELELMGE